MSEYKIQAQNEYKEGMAMYAGIFIGNYAKNMAFKKYHSGANMSQIKLLRTRVTRFIEILQSGVIPRLKLNNTTLLLLVKSRRKLRS